MSFIRSNPEIEQWLDSQAEAWRFLSDSEYKSVVAHWKMTFWGHVELRHQSRTGSRAIAQLTELLPANFFLFTGVPVPALANTGGAATHGYHATALRDIDRDLLNTAEIILVDEQMGYSCVFSHEAGAMVREHLYVA